MFCDWTLTRDICGWMTKKNRRRKFISLKCANNQKISHMMTIMAKRIISCEWMWFRKKRIPLCFEQFFIQWRENFLCWVKKLESKFICDQNLVRKRDTCSCYRLMSTIGLYSFLLSSTTSSLSLYFIEPFYMLVALSHIHLRVIFATISKIVYILELSFAFHLSWRNNFCQIGSITFYAFLNQKDTSQFRTRNDKFPFKFIVIVWREVFGVFLLIPLFNAFVLYSNI